MARLAINPNTVLKAYRELERDGLVAARPGVGTFVTRSLADASLAAHEPLRRELRRWLAKARLAGLDEESIEALFTSTFRAAQRGHSVTAVVRTEGLGKRYRPSVGAVRTAPSRSRPGTSPGWSARTAPARPRC